MCARSGTFANTMMHTHRAIKLGVEVLQTNSDFGRSHTIASKKRRGKKITPKNNEMFIYFICFGWFLFSIVVVLLIFYFFILFLFSSSEFVQVLPCLCTNYLKWQRRIRITSSKIDTRQSDRSFDQKPHLLLPLWLCAAACFAAYSAAEVSAQTQCSKRLWQGERERGRGNKKEMPLKTQNVELSIWAPTIQNINEACKPHNCCRAHSSLQWTISGVWDFFIRSFLLKSVNRFNINDNALASCVWLLVLFSSVFFFFLAVSIVWYRTFRMDYGT